MEENTITMRGAGHSAPVTVRLLFKNNYLFRSWTRITQLIVDYLIFARELHLPL